MPGKAAKVVVPERQWAILEEFRRSKTEPRSVSERAAIIVGAFQGRSNQEIAEAVGLERHAVGTWRRRWQDGWDELTLLECTQPARLRDANRETFQRQVREVCEAYQTAVARHEAEGTRTVCFDEMTGLQPSMNDLNLIEPRTVFRQIDRSDSILEVR